MKFNKSHSLFIIFIVSLLVIVAYVSSLPFVSENLPAPYVLEKGKMRVENPAELEDAFFELSGLWDFYWAHFIEPQFFIIPVRKNRLSIPFPMPVLPFLPCGIRL